MSDHPRPHADLAGYVLGVLGPDEAEVFEAHLEGCAECRDEVAALSPIPALLEHAAPPQRVPPTLADRTFSAVERTAARQHRRRVTAGALAAVAAIALAALLVLRPLGDAPFEIELASATSDATGVALVSRSPNGLRIDMRLRDLPPTPEGTHYECWYVAPDDTRDEPRRVTGGTFVAPDGGDVDITMFTAASAEDYPGLDVTLEVDDGDPARGGAIVLAAR